MPSPRPVDPAPRRARAGGPPVFDAHLHIVDPRFPLVPNEGYVTEPFTVADASDEELRALDAAGVRGVRFNLRRGGRAALEGLTPLGPRAAALFGWASELYVDARDLPDLAPSLKALPKLGIDHPGLCPPPAPGDRTGTRTSRSSSTR